MSHSYFFLLDKFPFTPAPIPAPDWWDDSEEGDEF